MNGCPKRSQSKQFRSNGNEDHNNKIKVTKIQKITINALRHYSHYYRICTHVCKNSKEVSMNKEILKTQ